MSNKIPFDAIRPKKISEEAWLAIIEAWENGLSDREAAFRVVKNTGEHIKESDIKMWKRDYPEVAELSDYLQSAILAKAKLNIREKIEAGDVATSKWYLERKAADEFSTKAAVAFEGAAIELSIEDKEKAAKEFMKQFGE